MMNEIILSNIKKVTEDPSIESLTEKAGIQSCFYTKTYQFNDEEHNIKFNFLNDDRIHDCQIDDNAKDFNIAKPCIKQFLNTINTT